MSPSAQKRWQRDQRAICTCAGKSGEICLVERGTSTRQPHPLLSRPGEQPHECATAAPIGDIGRPGKTSEMIRLSTASLDAARRAAASEGVGIREWIERTLTKHGVLQ